jgi:hypothetical protein
MIEYSLNLFTKPPYTTLHFIHTIPAYINNFSYQENILKFHSLKLLKSIQIILITVKYSMAANKNQIK